jgi:hypothetical protein
VTPFQKDFFFPRLPFSAFLFPFPSLRLPFPSPAPQQHQGLKRDRFPFSLSRNFPRRGDHLIAPKQTVAAALNLASGLLRYARNDGYNAREQPTRIVATRLRVNVFCGDRT